jgi:hypothetical protein
MVNSGPEIYLTDFLESRFSREFAKIRGFCGGEIFETAAFTISALTTVGPYENTYGAS